MTEDEWTRRIREANDMQPKRQATTPDKAKVFAYLDALSARPNIDVDGAWPYVAREFRTSKGEACMLIIEWRRTRAEAAP